MGSRWLKIQDRSFCIEFKNTELKKCGAELLIMWSVGDERQSWWCRVTVHRLVGLFDGPFSGNPTLIGPWGCPMALPCRWGMTDSSNEACHRRARDHSRAGSELQWARVTSKEFWFLSSGEGGEKKKTPLGDSQPCPAFEYSSVYRVSVLGAGDTQKRHEEWGVAVVNFS